MSVLRHLRMIYGVAYLSSRWIKRQPAWLLQTILSYIGFAILLYVWGGLEGLRNLIIAMIVGGLWSTGVNIVAQDVGWARVMGLQDMFIASPVRPVHYIVGHFISAMVFPAITALAIIPLIHMLGAWRIALASLVLGLPALLTGIMIGLYIVMRVEKPVNISAITNPISWLLVILPPVYYPAWLIPEKLRVVSLLPPTAAAAELARQLSGMGVSVPAVIPAVILLAWVTLGVLLLVKTMRWGME